MASIIFIIMVILALVFGAGLIVLQIYLSKKESRWPGLILPCISLALSLLVTVGVFMYTAAKATTVYTEQQAVIDSITGTYEVGDVIVYPAEPTHGGGGIAGENASSAIFTTLLIFLLSNIPTAVYLIIYACCRGGKSDGRSRKRELEHMELQDL